MITTRTMMRTIADTDTITAPIITPVEIACVICVNVTSPRISAKNEKLNQ